jgi:predicted phosphoribosyltransferase
MLFCNRHHAGQDLAARLMDYRDRADVVVLALPRGGVPVGFEVSRAIHAPLDVFLVRKLGVPGHEELAMGAIASGGTIVLNEDVVVTLRIPQRVIDAVVERERAELERRECAYRGGRAPAIVRGRTVLLVDDGLATGASMKAAVRALQHQQPKEIVVAVPVGAPETCAELEGEVTKVVCASMPVSFGAVGLWYEDFTPTSDAEVRELLNEATHGWQSPQVTSQ